MAPNGILQVNTNAVYSPIQIPSSKPMTIVAGSGFNPVITGINGITLLNGAQDVTISGLTLDGCTTGDTNALGAAICLDHLAVVSRIIFANMKIRNVLAGSGVMLSYHQSIGGDNYAWANVYPGEFSNRIAFVSCDFFDACKDGNEGANLAIRGIDLSYFSKCTINGNTTPSARGVQLQNCLRFLVEDCEAFGFNTIANNEAFKADLLNLAPNPAPLYRISGTFRNCIAHDAFRGFNIDDQTNVYVVKCLAYNCTDFGYRSKGGATFGVGSYECNIGHDNGNGMLMLNGSKYFLRSNQMYNNPTGTGGFGNNNYDQQHN